MISVFCCFILLVLGYMRNLKLIIQIILAKTLGTVQIWNCTNKLSLRKKNFIISYVLLVNDPTNLFDSFTKKRIHL